MLMEQQTVKNPAVIHDLCAMTKQVMHARSSLPPDDKQYNIYDPSMVLLLAHHWVLCYCSLAKPDSLTKVSLTLRNYGY